MTLAQIGPITSGFEAVATSVGAGVILGSVAMGIFGLILGWSKQAIGDRALTDGYIGGLAGALVAALDAFLRYGL